MFKSLIVACSLVALAGCAAGPTVAEGSGSTSSDELAYPKTDDDKLLDALEEKANNCEVFSDHEIATLESYNSTVDFTFEGYVSFTCSIEAGVLIVNSLEMEKRAGWSSDDGIFTEQAMTASASVTIPLKAVEISGSLEHEVTIRNAGTTITRDDTTSIAAGVSRDLGLAEAEATVSFDDTNSVSIEGGMSTAPLPIPTAGCDGDTKFGFTLSLSAKSVLDTRGRSTAAANALRLHAGLIEARGHSNFLAMGGGQQLDAATRAADLKACCDGWKTCTN
jgi:hypothetical protein